MAVGEAQILGQVRRRAARRPGRRRRRPAAVGRAAPAGPAGRQAGARRDRHRPGRARPWSRPACDAAPSRWSARWPRPAVLVVGAGAMGGLAVADRAPRAGVAELAVVNRTATAGRPARRVGAGGRGADLAELPSALADADVVVACTGASGTWSTSPRPSGAQAAACRTARWSTSTWPCPATSTPRSPTLPGVTLVDLERARPAPRRRRRRRGARPGPGPGRRGGRGVPGRAARRGRSPRPWSRCARMARVGGRGRAGAAGRPGCPTSTTRSAAEVAADRAPGRRQAAAHPDRAGQGAGRGARRRAYAEALRELFDLDPDGGGADRGRPGSPGQTCPMPRVQVDVPEPSGPQGGDR